MKKKHIVQLTRNVRRLDKAIFGRELIEQKCTILNWTVLVQNLFQIHISVIPRFCSISFMSG